MAGRSGVDRRAIYVPPMAVDACNIRTTVTSGTGDRPRKPRGQEGDPTSRTSHSTWTPTVQEQQWRIALRGLPDPARMGISDAYQKGADTAVRPLTVCGRGGFRSAWPRQRPKGRPKGQGRKTCITTPEISRLSVQVYTPNSFGAKWFGSPVVPRLSRISLRYAGYWSTARTANLSAWRSQRLSFPARRDMHCERSVTHARSSAMRVLYGRQRLRPLNRSSLISAWHRLAEKVVPSQTVTDNQNPRAVPHMESDPINTSTCPSDRYFSSFYSPATCKPLVFQNSGPISGHKRTSISAILLTFILIMTSVLNLSFM